MDSKSFWELYQIIQKENFPEFLEEFKKLEKEWEFLEHRAELLKKGEVSLRLAVIGDYSTGKSTFINSILGGDFLPTGDLPTTKIITLIKYGDIPKVWIRRKDGFLIESNINELKNLHFQKNQKEIRDIDCFEVHYPSYFLRSFEVVDTPGFGDPAEEKKEEYERLTHEEIKKADAFIFLFNVNKLASASELQHLDLEELKDKRVVAIINQMDLKHEKKHEEIISWFKKKYGKKFEAVIPYSAKKVLDSKMYEEFIQVFQNELPEVCMNEGVSIIKIRKKDGEYIISAKKGGFLKRKVVFEKKVNLSIGKEESYYIEWFKEAIDVFRRFRKDMIKIIERKNKEERARFEKNIKEFLNKLNHKLDSKKKKYEGTKKKIEEMRKEISKKIDGILAKHLNMFKNTVVDDMVYVFIKEKRKEGWFSTKYHIILEPPSDEKISLVLKNYDIKEFISDIEDSLPPVEKIIEEFPEKEELKKEYYDIKNSVSSYVQEDHERFLETILKSKNAIASWCMYPLRAIAKKSFSTPDGDSITYEIDESTYNFFKQYIEKDIKSLIDMCIRPEVMFSSYNFDVLHSFSLFLEKLIYQCDLKIESINENLQKIKNSEDKI